MRTPRVSSIRPRRPSHDDLLAFHDHLSTLRLELDQQVIAKDQVGHQWVMSPALAVAYTRWKKEQKE